jgi:hypothetical protein
MSAEIPCSSGVGRMPTPYTGLLVSPTPQEYICTHWDALAATASKHPSSTLVVPYIKTSVALH